MQNFSASYLPFLRCKACIFILLCFWTFGILFGCLTAIRIPECDFSWMHTVPAHCASIVGLLFTGMLPFLLTAAAVCFSLEWTLFLLAFYRAFSIGYLSLLMLWSCDSGGWLARGMILFPDLICIPFLFRLWVQIFQGATDQLYGRLLSCSLICAAVTAIDYLVISPYLASLIL